MLLRNGWSQDGLNLRKIVISSFSWGEGALAKLPEKFRAEEILLVSYWQSCRKRGNASQSSAASERERGCSFEPLFISGGLIHPNRSAIPLH
jgi:hypothetical protein